MYINMIKASQKSEHLVKAVLKLKKLVVGRPVNENAELKTICVSKGVELG